MPCYILKGTPHLDGKLSNKVASPSNIAGFCPSFYTENKSVSTSPGELFILKRSSLTRIFIFQIFDFFFHRHSLFFFIDVTAS